MRLGFRSAEGDLSFRLVFVFIRVDPLDGFVGLLPVAFLLILLARALYFLVREACVCFAASALAGGSRKSRRSARALMGRPNLDAISVRESVAVSILGAGEMASAELAAVPAIWDVVES